nr:hypothetical protein CFP56_36558 [Quercus suber]
MWLAEKGCSDTVKQEWNKQCSRNIALVASGWENARVASLFDTSHQVWNLGMLQLLFNPRDVDLIQSIPLSGKPVEDVLVWPFTLTGSYIVKSGYRFLYKSRSLDNNEHQPKDNTLWKKTWGLQVHPKV